MVTCSQCAVNNVERRCTNTPSMCFQCCSEHPTTLTCPSHYSSMGTTAAAARRQANMVHPAAFDSAEPDGDDRKVDDEQKVDNSSNTDSAHVAQPPPSEQLPPGGQPPRGGQQPPGGPSSPRSSSASAVPPPPTLTLESLAASMAAMQAAMQANFLALSQRMAPPAPPAPAPTVTTAILPRLPPPSPAHDTPALVPAPSPPHRAAVLDRAAVASQHDINALVNRISALPDNDSDFEDDDAQVASHSHSHATPVHSASQRALPSAFIPPPVGTEQNASQQLAAIFSAMSKQGGKTKYSSLEELNEALTDWAADAVRSGRTAAQLNSIRAYQQLLITQFAISDRMPLKQLLEYHRLWCKGVHAGTIDMFAPGAAMNHDIYYTVTHPLRLSPHGSFPTNPQQRDGKNKTTSDKKQTPKRPTAAHLAGSCTHHPTSTSHTTAECIKKSK